MIFKNEKMERDHGRQYKNTFCTLACNGYHEKGKCSEVLVKL